MTKDKIVMGVYFVWMSIIFVVYALFLKAINQKVNDELVNNGCANVNELMAKYAREKKFRKQ